MFGVDYFDTFASVMTTKSFRTLLAIWGASVSMHHWDITTAFVNAKLDETIFCDLPKRFVRRELSFD